MTWKTWPKSVKLSLCWKTDHGEILILNVDYSCFSGIIDNKTIFYTLHLKQFWNNMEELRNVKMNNTVYLTNSHVILCFIYIKMDKTIVYIMQHACTQVPLLCHKCNTTKLRCFDRCLYGAYNVVWVHIWTLLPRSLQWWRQAVNNNSADPQVGKLVCSYAHLAYLLLE